MNGKEVIVKEQVGKVVRAILSVKDFIRSAVSTEPHAALAWAGVLVILPVSIYMQILFHFSMLTSALQILVNPVTQDDNAMEGLGYISELLLRCKVIEITYRKSSIKDQRYLANCVKHSRGCQRLPKPVLHFQLKVFT